MVAERLVVRASFQSDEGRPEQGFLAFIDNAVDRPTGTIKLKAEFTNGERRLWPGQFVNVALTLATENDAVIVPSEAVQVGPEGQQVFVVKEDKRVEMRLVTVGRTEEGQAIIAKGLRPGEVVVREGQFLLAPGSRVEIKDAAKPVDGAVDAAAESRKRAGGKEKTKARDRGAS
jgi:multidrug efflux system membrane fusion protein